MPWDERWARAWEYAHNVLRLRSPLLGRFAHAYADLTEHEPNWSMAAFSLAWEAGEFSPDNIGLFHHREWFEKCSERIA